MVPKTIRVKSQVFELFRKIRENFEYKNNGFVREMIDCFCNETGKEIYYNSNNNDDFHNIRVNNHYYNKVKNIRREYKLTASNAIYTLLKNFIEVYGEKP